MRKVIFGLLWLVLMGQSVASYGQQEDIFSDLASHKEWRQLITYGDGNRGQANSAGFYLAEDGRENPESELIKTVAALLAPAGDDVNSHAQCRFPARKMWLKEKLPTSLLGMQELDCSEFVAFSGSGADKSVSFVFATGFLGNPASYYGHVLVKVNTSKVGRDEKLQDATVNFGAKIPENENMAVYILKGMFGGYQSSFTHMPFFYHAKNYGENENRDLWEYQLDLSDRNRDFLIAYAWDLQSAEYQYFFANRNCAYRMGEMLELVVGRDMVSPIRPWAVPQALATKLAKIKRNGKSIISKVVYHPSRQSRLYQRYGALDVYQTSFVHKVVGNPRLLPSIESNHFTLEEQHQILDALMDYYQYVRKEDKGEADPNNASYNAVLAYRYQLSPGAKPVEYSSSSNPHKGREPSYLSITAVSHKHAGEYSSVHLRPAYYDSLDSDYGHIKNAQLSMAEITLLVKGYDVYVGEFNLVKIESLRRNFTGLPGDKQHAWDLELGAEQRHSGQFDDLVAKFSSGYGLSRSLFSETLFVSALAGAGYRDDQFSEEGIYAAGRIALNLDVGKDLRFRFDAEHRRFLDKDKDDLYKATLRWAPVNGADVRAYIADDQGVEVGLSVGLYW
jgi:hypothetical protein